MEAVVESPGQHNLSSKLNGTEGDIHSDSGGPESLDVYKNANVDISKLVHSVIADTMRSGDSSQREERPLSAGATNDTLQALARTSGSLALQQSSIGNPNIKPATAEQIAVVIANAEREYREKKQQQRQSLQGQEPQQQQLIGDTQTVAEADSRTSNNELVGSVHEPPTKLPAPESFRPLQMQHDVSPGKGVLSTNAASNKMMQTPSKSQLEASNQNNPTKEEGQASGRTTPKAAPATMKPTPTTLIGQNTGLAVMSAMGSRFQQHEESSGALYRSPVESIIATKSVKDSIISGGKDSTEKSSKKSKKSHKKRLKSTEITNLNQALETMSNTSDAGSQVGSTAPSRDSSIAGSAPHSPKSDSKSRSGSFFSSIFSWRGNKEEGQYPMSLPQNEADRLSAGDSESSERHPVVSVMDGNQKYHTMKATVIQESI
ncbi:protein rtoA-like isoform X1 [Ptychodera flava]|uniref:protein rtoA-like isoform X1 n=2 Tax=Ptychodera flava TaxID=63121 RepID=UPI00396A3081